MIVVVARPQDQVARSLVTRWSPFGAALLSSDDFSTAGWSYHLGSPGSCTAVIGGHIVPVAQITGVLTRLPAIAPQDLGHIAPDDRDYVAAEMTAFLISWLAALNCPVLNKPSPGCASGPNWREERWFHTAARLGIPVSPLRRLTGQAGDSEVKDGNLEPARVTVVGTRCFGSVDAALMVQAQRLADAARVDLLEVYFRCPEAGAEFLGADLWPDVTVPEVADAALEYVTRGVAW